MWMRLIGTGNIYDCRFGSHFGVDKSREFPQKNHHHPLQHQHQCEGRHTSISLACRWKKTLLSSSNSPRTHVSCDCINQIICWMTTDESRTTDGCRCFTHECTLHTPTWWLIEMFFHHRVESHELHHTHEFLLFSHIHSSHLQSSTSLAWDEKILSSNQKIWDLSFIISSLTIAVTPPTIELKLF